MWSVLHAHPMCKFCAFCTSLTNHMCKMRFFRIWGTREVYRAMTTCARQAFLCGKMLQQAIIPEQQCAVGVTYNAFRSGSRHGRASITTILFPYKKWRREPKKYVWADVVLKSNLKGFLWFSYVGNIEIYNFKWLCHLPGLILMLIEKILPNVDKNNNFK